MAGFFKNLPMTSFVTGAANQLNKNFQAGKEKQNTDDAMLQLWGQKADYGIQRDNEQQQQLKNDANTYNFLRASMGGSDYGADQLFDYVKRTNLDKKPGWGSDEGFVAMQKSLKDKIAQNQIPQNYQPQTMSSLQAQMNQIHSHSQGLYDTAQQRGYKLPLTQPNQMDLTQQQSPADPNAGFDFTAKGSNKTGGKLQEPSLKPTDFKDATSYQKYAQSFMLNPANPDLSGVLGSDVRQQNAINTEKAKKPTAQEAADAETLKESGRKYADDLEKRVASIPTLQGAAMDAQNIVGQLVDHGLKVGALNPTIDAMNRILSVISGSDFAGVMRSMGVEPNTITDINTFKKNLGNMTLNNIPMLHAPRLTNYELSFLQTTLPNIGADKDTDLRIALVLRDAAMRGIKQARGEYDAMYGEGGSPAKARQVRMELMKERDTDQPPWPVIDMSTVNPDDVAKYQALPVGGYYEDRATGRMIKKGG